MKNKALLAVVVAVSIAGTGCYGKFSLTRKVHTFNGGVSANKFVNSAVMWGLLVIPVYEVAALIDLFILNTVEVLTGKNPVTLREGDDPMQVRSSGVAWRFDRLSATEAAVLRGDELRGRVRLLGDGRAALEDTHGHLLATLPAGALPPFEPGASASLD